MDFFTKYILNISDINTAAEKYWKLYINVFIFRMYNVD
jgi:hypothetical protein